MGVQELISEHSSYILNLLGRYTPNRQVAEDVFQQSCEKAVKCFHQLRDVKKFRSWFATIAVSLAKNAHTRNKHARHEVIVEDFSFASGEKSALDKLCEKATETLLRQFIETLPERQRKAFTLRFFDELPFMEIAEIMNCPYDTAKANYRHALVKLKNEFHVEQL